MMAKSKVAKHVADVDTLVIPTIQLCYDIYSMHKLLLYVIHELTF